ncbi:MAG: acyl-CoA thioester hydrolase/BAAT C-terminal domain-containing protein [Acidimicrobiales bacterium]
MVTAPVVQRSLVVVLLVVLVAGCGDDDSGGASAGGERDSTGRTERFSVADVDFVGTLAVPGGEGPWPGVVVLGGSDGRQPTPLAEMLADEGYVALALSYFSAPGLPGQLAGIPLEYFETALGWLADRPEVDADHLVVWGASRGGEAALLVAATYPHLVGGVVAAVPANVVTCGLPDCDRPAWTLGGEAVPYVDEFGGAYYDNHPDAEIPVERIAGPVLLICGGQDRVWPSCPMSHAVIDRLDASDHSFPHQLLEYPDAGHFVSVPPAVPWPDDQLTRGGGTVDANNRDREDAWDQTLDFLADASK